MKRKLPSQKGFSLVEVALALGIASFCLITLMALLPVGVQHYKQADTQIAMANLAGMIIRDLEATPTATSASPSPKSPRFQFPIPAAAGGASGNNPTTLYVDSVGMPTGSIGAAPTSASVYRLSLFFTPPGSASQRGSTTARLQITFPALADNSPASLPSKYSDIFQTTVALNRN